MTIGEANVILRGLFRLFKGVCRLFKVDGHTGRAFVPTPAGRLFRRKSLFTFFLETFFARRVLIERNSPATMTSSSSPLGNHVSSGVVTGVNLQRLYNHAKSNGYVIPAFAGTSMVTCNIILEAAKRCNSPVAIRITYVACAAGSCNNTREGADATVANAVTLALHVRMMARNLGIPVILQSETRCIHRLATWYEGLLVANKAYYTQHKEPLFSCHLFDITCDVHDEEELTAIVNKHMERHRQLNMWLHVVVPCTLKKSNFQSSNSSSSNSHDNPIEDNEFYGITQQHLWNALELVPKNLCRSSLAVSWMKFQDDDDVFVVIDDSEVVSQQLKKPIKNSCIVQMNIMNNGYSRSQKTEPAEEILLEYSNIIEALNSTGQYPATGQQQQQQRNRQETTNRRNREWDYLPPTPQRNSSSSSSSLLVRNSVIFFFVSTFTLLLFGFAASLIYLS